MKTLTELKKELDLLQDVRWHQRVRETMKQVLLERQPEIAALEAEIKALQSKRKPKSPRWPEFTPAPILDLCAKFWSGTTEFSQYRIHLWNSKAVWTSYPSGGYSNNGGWKPMPCCYELVSLTEKENRLGKVIGKILKSHTGRISSKDMKAALDALEEPA